MMYRCVWYWLDGTVEDGDKFSVLAEQMVAVTQNWSRFVHEFPTLLGVTIVDDEGTNWLMMRVNRGEHREL